MKLCFYISGHGFGHASRDIEIINAIVRQDPAVRVVVRTAVPDWFLRASLDADAEIVHGQTDTGVVQPDSLSIDETETARRAAAFHAEFASLVSPERDLLARHHVDLVLGDIPPLAFAAADAAGLPSIAVGNFTWDWIYGGYPQFDRLAPSVRHIIAEADSKASLALRMPFAGGFDGMVVEDVPLVARHATRDRTDTRRVLRLPADRPVVLATFGGHGRGVPLDRAACRGDFTIVATEYETGGDAAPANLKVFTNRELRDAGVSYTDLVAAADVAVTKLGYGIVSECIANDVPLLYTTRGHFREQEVFERELPGVARCASISREQLVEGDWSSAVERLLSQPAPKTRMPSNGAEVIAQQVLALAQAD